MNMKKVEAKKFRKTGIPKTDFGNCCIRSQRYGGYVLEFYPNETNKHEEYLIHYMIGCVTEMEQISNKDFWFGEFDLYGNKKLSRVQISKGKTKVLYRKIYENCYELSDDLMLFEIKRISDYEQKQKKVKKYSVYSLKENKELESFDWLSNGYDVTPIKTDDDKIVLHIIKELRSEQGNDYVQFLVDSQNYKPISAVHSTLRDSYIDVSTKEDVQKLIKEDVFNKKIVDSQLSNMSKQSKKQATEELFFRK